MNHPRMIYLLCWQTRNWRHKKAVVECCKNYGFRKIFTNVYAGKITARTMNEMQKVLRDIFIKKTEIFYILSLCKSCISGSAISGDIKKALLTPPEFEIIG